MSEPAAFRFLHLKLRFKSGKHSFYFLGGGDICAIRCQAQERKAGTHAEQQHLFLQSFLPQESQKKLGGVLSPTRGTQGPGLPWPAFVLPPLRMMKSRLLSHEYCFEKNEMLEESL